ncbi:MAG: ATP-binding protein [bacterium]|jgi:serine/threonine-protein kinase RsbW|nr:ATP-binding protein [bacterium]
MGNTTKTYELSRVGTFDQVEEFASLVQRVARERALPEEEEVDLMIAVMEAVNNAILHGNQEDERKHVHMKIETGPSEITVWIQDEGGGFLVAGVPDPLAPDNVMNASGRGILMMQAFMDSVEISPTETGTLVKLTKEFSTKPSI